MWNVEPLALSDFPRPSKPAPVAAPDQDPPYQFAFAKTFPSPYSTAWRLLSKVSNGSPTSPLPGVEHTCTPYQSARSMISPGEGMSHPSVLSELCEMLGLQSSRRLGDQKERQMRLKKVLWRSASLMPEHIIAYIHPFAFLDS